MRKGIYFLIFLLIFFGSFIFAQMAVTFPVAELGNCADFRECADFCERPENFRVCTDFAEAHGMTPPEEADRARKMIESTEMGGPGGCIGKDECEAYCNIPDHMEECIVFGLEQGFIPPDEIEEAKMVLAAIRQGVRPPPCAGPEACDIYCSQPEHLEECLEFGIAAGLIPPDEAEMARRTGGRGPGGCRGRAECDAYCQDPANMEECMTFAIEHGLMPPEEIEDAKKMMEAMKKGVRPPPCRGEEECDIYCSQPEHVEECVNFAVAAGFMSPEEAEDAKKMMKAGLMAGPGGCKGKEECEAYCDNPDHMLECIEFGEKAGFISPEEAEKARKMGESGMMMGQGPGGCRGPEECKAYCDDPNNMQECMEFGEKMGVIKPEEKEMMEGIIMEGGPGGCKSKEECESYCADQAHLEECLSFGAEKGITSPIEGMAPPEGMMPPEGIMPPKEYMGPPPEGMMPPEGMPPMEKMPPEEMMPPEEFMKPSEEIMPPPEEMMVPPPEEMMPPPEEMMPPEEAPLPPPEEEAPQTLLDLVYQLFANVTVFLLR